MMRARIAPKTARCLTFRRNVIARYARASLVKGVSAYTVRYAASESLDNVTSLRRTGGVYPARWMYIESWDPRMVEV
jgi:hypothetical protein